MRITTPNLQQDLTIFGKFFTARREPRSRRSGGHSKKEAGESTQTLYASALVRATSVKTGIFYQYYSPTQKIHRMELL